MARVHVLTAAVLFGTPGTARALGPDIEPLAVGSARIVVGAALLALVALAAGRAGRKRAGGARASLGSGRPPPRAPLRCFRRRLQASFFAAVADTGVAVGTVVALGSAPALAGGIEWAITRKAPEKAWAMATSL